MTNAQKWVAAVLGLFLLLFLLEKLTQKEEPLTHPGMGETMQESTQSTGELDGLTLIRKTGCISCHGDNLQGTNLAPKLEDINENWTRDGLINYLRNPSSYSGDKRFDEYREKYKNIMMPSYGNLDVKDLGKIAEYLLTK